MVRNSLSQTSPSDESLEGFWVLTVSRNRFHSDKICDISYANIQGKESLIEKFRNSCVMDEDPSYRPKIFHSNGALMGQEQEFPEPNNTRRKLRSIACARQIGSFPHNLPSLNSPFPHLSLWPRVLFLMILLESEARC